MDVTKPNEYLWFGDIHGLKPYEFMGPPTTMMSRTPVINAMEFWPASSSEQVGLRPQELPTRKTKPVRR